MGCFQSIHCEDLKIQDDVKKNDENIKQDLKENNESDKDDKDIYNNCTYENTPEFTFNGMKKMVKVLKVIDGDTVDIALYHDGLSKSFRHRVRLYGIDTPEKRPPKNDPNRDKEIAASKSSSDALTNYLKKNDNIVLALFYNSDKYGRLMCTFYDKTGENINKWMVLNGFAYEYFGKTKKKYEES